MVVRMVNPIARTIPSFGAMCPLLVSRLSDFYGGIIGGMCELLHTSNHRYFDGNNKGPLLSARVPFLIGRLTLLPP